MSSTIEDRLAAALDARAELVTPQDLRPLEVPEPPGRLARPAVLLLAAAVTAAVVATPFVLTRDDGSAPAPGPAGTPSVAPSDGSRPAPGEETTAPGPGRVTAGLAVAARQRADVDGDGRPDRVRLLTDAASPDEPGESGRVEVTLATGESGAAEVPGGYADLERPFAVNRDDREQVLLSHTQGGDAAQLLVYTWLDGALTRATQEGDAPLGLEMGGERVFADYYIDDRGLVSWRRLGEGASSEVEQWTWSLDGDRLVPTRSGKGCVDATGDAQPRPC